MTAYIRRVTLVVEAADQAAANQQAATLDPDTGGNKTFSVPLSFIGSNPPTHYACFGVVTLATLAAIEALHASDFPNGKIYRGHNPYDDEPAITRWTFEDAIADMGLQVIE